MGQNQNLVYRKYFLKLMHPSKFIIMKKVVLFSVLLISSLLSEAQFSNEWLGPDNKHLLYSNMDLMVGNSSGGNLGMTFVYNSKFSVEFGYSAVSNDFSNSIPILKSANSSENSEDLIPTELMDNFNIMVGRHFNLNRNKTIRFVLQGGPGLSVMRQTFNNQSNNIEPTLSENSKDLSVILNSKFEFPIIDLVGFSFGPTLVMNHEKTYLTFCVGIMYGILTTE